MLSSNKTSNYPKKCKSQSKLQRIQKESESRLWTRFVTSVTTIASARSFRLTTNGNNKVANSTGRTLLRSFRPSALRSLQICRLKQWLEIRIGVTKRPIPRTIATRLARIRTGTLELSLTTLMSSKEKVSCKLHRTVDAIYHRRHCSRPRLRIPTTWIDFHLHHPVVPTELVETSAQTSKKAIHRMHY